MKSNYENTLNIIGQCPSKLAEIVQSTIESMPQSMVGKINSGKEEGVAHKNGYEWTYSEDRNGFSLSVAKVKNQMGKDYISVNLLPLSKKNLIDWPRGAEKTIASITLYFYKKELRGKRLKMTYDFNMAVIDDRYVVKVTVDNNTSIKINQEIMESSSFKEEHEKLIGMMYVANVSPITGEDRKKRNKIIL